MEAVARRAPVVSVVVVVHDMAREAPRTLLSLSAAYQRDIDPADFEVIVVDNGSETPLDAAMVATLAGNFRLIRLDPAPPSPARAINRGLAEARGDVIGVMIDGARIATPGLLHFARHGAAVYDKAVVAALGWYIGHDFQSWSVARGGYDRAREDGLLGAIAWPDDGYRLFEIGTMDESSGSGWFQPISESNAVFARRELWEEIGGVDERFDAPGGGLINLDLFARLLRAADDNLVLMLGEGTFHQVHGGANTNASPERQPENFGRWAAQYAEIRGKAWALPPRRKPPAYIGTLPRAALVRLVRAATHSYAGHLPPPLEPGFETALLTGEPFQPQADERIARLIELGRAYFTSGNLEASCAIARLLRERAPGDRSLDPVLSLAAPAVTVDGPAPAARPAYHVALGEAHELLGERDAAATHFRAALAQNGNLPQAHLGLSRLRMPGPGYLAWLKRLYEALAPELVIEIGVYEGSSLALLSPPTIAIGVDPTPRVLSPLTAQTHIFPETSDAFFARDGARPFLGSRVVSAGFIDGLHTFEQALRDFAGLEALCGPRSLIVLHDTVPLDEATQSRSQETAFYSGDVWKAILCLKHYRPDLDVFTIPTAPTGLTVICGLDPASRVLENVFDEAFAKFIDMPFATIANDLDNALSIIPADWELVASRLERHHVLT